MPRVTKTTKTLYDLTRKGRPFNWGKEQQDSFEVIKHRLIKLPVLHMPNKTDTSKFATGSAFTRYKMVNLNQLHMQTKDFLRQQKVIPSQSWNCVD